VQASASLTKTETETTAPGWSDRQWWGVVHKRGAAGAASACHLLVRGGLGLCWFGVAHHPHSIA